MSDNTLGNRSGSVGWLYPGEVKEGAGIPATLVREGHQVRLLFRWKPLFFISGGSVGDGGDVFYSDDPGRTKYQYNVP